MNGANANAVWDCWIILMVCVALIAGVCSLKFKKRNRYLSKPFKDPRQWSKTFMDSIKQERL